MGDGGGNIWRIESENIDNLSVAQLKNLKAKRSREAATLGLIKKGLDDPICSRIMTTTNTKQAWKTL